MATAQVARSLLWVGGVELSENPRNSAVPSNFRYPNDRSVSHDLSKRPGEDPKLCWIGHATFYVTISGIGILTDPIWSNRVVPHLSRSIAMNWCGPKRRFPPPFEVEDVQRLPFVHLVLISHNHYDHLDEFTVDRLNARFPSIHWVVPLKMKSWFLDKGFSKDKVTELDWWENTILDIEPFVDGNNICGAEAQASAETQCQALALPSVKHHDGTPRCQPGGATPVKGLCEDASKFAHTIKVTVHFVPSKHHSGRHFFDQNRSGWGGYVIDVPYSAPLREESIARSTPRSPIMPIDTGTGTGFLPPTASDWAGAPADSTCQQPPHSQVPKRTRHMGMDVDSRGRLHIPKSTFCSLSKSPFKSSLFCLPPTPAQIASKVKMRVKEKLNQDSITGMQGQLSEVYMPAIGPTAKKTLYFAGDTAYDHKYFVEIGDVFPNIDVALIPIGAYSPRSLNKTHHVDPEEAVKIHQDVGPRMSVAMHWNTFKMTEEFFDQPPWDLYNALPKYNVHPKDFRVIDIGQYLTF